MSVALTVEVVGCCAPCTLFNVATWIIIPALVSVAAAHLYSVRMHAREWLFIFCVYYTTGCCDVRDCLAYPYVHCSFEADYAVRLPPTLLLLAAPQRLVAHPFAVCLHMIVRGAGRAAAEHLADYCCRILHQPLCFCPLSSLPRRLFPSLRACFSMRCDSAVRSLVVV